jgi:hypothetical protein
MLADVRLSDPPADVLTVNGVGDAFAFVAPFGDGWYRIFAWNRRHQVEDSAPVELSEVREATRRALGTDFGLYLTQCGRALDSRRPRPFLGDATADEIAARIGWDCTRFPMPASSITDIALRAKKLDGVVRGFVARHPDAVVLDLGAGLDNRMARVAPPEPERWEPRLRLAQEILLTREPDVAAYPTALRVWTRLAAHSTALSRRGTTVLRYRFPA